MSRWVFKMKIKHALNLLVLSFALIPLNSHAGFFDFLNPQLTKLNCKFTSGYYTLFGERTNSKILWTFNLVLDKPNNSVFWSSGERQELIRATYAANRVQFPFQIHGDKKTITLNLEDYSFQMVFQDNDVYWLNKGICSKR